MPRGQGLLQALQAKSCLRESKSAQNRSELCASELSPLNGFALSIPSTICGFKCDFSATNIDQLLPLMQSEPEGRSLALVLAADCLRDQDIIHALTTLCHFNQRRTIFIQMEFN